MTYVRQVTRLRVRRHILGLYLLAAGWAFVVATLLGVPWYGVLGLVVMTECAALSCVRAWIS